MVVGMTSLRLPRKLTTETKVESRALDSSVLVRVYEELCCY